MSVAMSTGSGPGLQSLHNEPELIEIDPEVGGDGEKKYKCSFCPNKIFKKKPEVGTHLESQTFT